MSTEIKVCTFNLRVIADVDGNNIFYNRKGRIADTIKEDSPEAIQQLKNMGIHVVMLTGDHEKTAKAIGAQAGVDEVIAGVLPDGKEKVIRRLQRKGKVAMVGDGINDALALTKADIGIAMGGLGSDAAIEAAEKLAGKIPFFEVNTGAIARRYRKRPYPSGFLLKELKHLGFGVVISSDCHDRKMLDCEFEFTNDLLKKCGFNEKYILTKKGFEPVLL